ncbi:glucose-6-phosphate dehydrogenase [Rhizosaccharibacter radicis]|uniref:Glucose-6-phosphate 1-dehydrogenase n=1 Tax=Rhizosaccharibacter radicis TaxID=2782605 RepID=A0ABT1W0Y3_9PROT|nr:glucose-6-phosphate dehydrogenase [Acetobacteraceae bacterium KSS12]
MNSHVETFDYVVFGATGDLTMRKLLPALYHRFRDGQIPADSRIIGTARSKLSHDEFRERAEKALGRFVKGDALDAETARRFLGMVFYASVNGAEADSTWPNLLELFGDDRQDKIRVFYLATSPGLYGAICQNLSDKGLVTDRSRVVLEKPIGHDLASARKVNDDVGKVFPENRVFRIDHYLGKETVQNLIALRFANPVFERLWSADAIDHVQITAAETVGVEGRGDYYDHSGALRDMIQNHLLQVMCLVAMEPPGTLGADDVRNEKLKVLRALKPIRPADVDHVAVRGQYGRGRTGDGIVPAYLEELGEGRQSNTETYVALRAEVHTWRWGKVPFFLRSGKRLPAKVSEVVIQFRETPWSIFPSQLQANRLILRLQPEEGIQLSIMNKDPAMDSMALRPANIDVAFEKAFSTRYPDAYERLLMDTVRGDPVLFMRRDEVEAAWTWVEPILDSWRERPDTLRHYSAGTWGPDQARHLLGSNRQWHEDM